LRTVLAPAPGGPHQILTSVNASLAAPVQRCTGGHEGESIMSVAKVIEITSESTESFDDAIRRGIARAEKSVRNVTGAWVKEHKLRVEDGRITGYRVDLMVTFVLTS